MHVRLLHGDQVSPNPTSARHEYRKAGTDGKEPGGKDCDPPAIGERQWGRARARHGQEKPVLLLDVQEGGEAGPSTSEATAAFSRAVPPPAGQTGHTPPSISLWAQEPLTRPPPLKQKASLLLNGLKNSSVFTMGSGVTFYSCFIKLNIHLILQLSNSTSRNLSKRTENTCP